jgi:hypothetical protein
MDIKVVTNSWSDTKQMEAALASALEELGIHATIAYIMNERSAEACMVKAPGLIVNGKRILENEMPSKEEMKKILSGLSP